MFQLKNFNSIVLSMINNAKATQSAITDWNVGSAARTLVEAPAIEIEEFYQRMLYGILDAIPVAIYNAFGFSFDEATAARGIVTISFSTPIVDPFVLPAGAVFKNPASGVAYLSQTDTAITAGAVSVDVAVVADRLGTIGNTGADSITQVLGAYLPNTASLSHLAITSGLDTESAAVRQARFAEFLGSLDHGTPAAALYAVKRAVVRDAIGNVTEYVVRAGLDETPGYGALYIYGSGGLPSADLLAAAQQLIDGTIVGDQYTAGYRPLGVRATVLPMAEQVVNIPMTLTATGDHATILSAIRTALTLLFNATDSKTTLLVPTIVDTILGVSGVQAAAVDLNQNIVIPANQVLKLGTTTPTWQ